MRRTKPQPARNKIDLTDPAQTRAWTRRLGISVSDLHRVVGKVGNSIAALSKEIEVEKTLAASNAGAVRKVDVLGPTTASSATEAGPGPTQC
jgi:hypothetical protein